MQVGRANGFNIINIIMRANVFNRSARLPLNKLPFVFANLFLFFFVMGQNTVEKRVFIVKTYFQTHSLAEVQRLFRLQFPDRNAPDKKNNWQSVKKYLDHGTSLNRNHP